MMENEVGKQEEVWLTRFNLNVMFEDDPKLWAG